MCGISGFLDLDHGVNTSVLHQMNDIIRYRGPDDEGYALIGRTKVDIFRGKDTIQEIAVPSIDQTAGTGYFLGFGHRRLSIVDLSVGGHQPMMLRDEKLAITYNGEIYNYLELRQELEDLGYQFRTGSDTEILLRAYQQWGEDCLQHFNGMWGFALWDGNKRRLFCARDRLGAKPFYYWQQGNRMSFGSELKQICQDDTIPKRFNEESIASALVHGLSDYSDETWIEGIYNLRPGHKLMVQLDDDCRNIQSVRTESYWKLDTTCRSDLSEAQWVQLVQEEFARSCKWRLRSDAPFAALLSGGLDSSCIIAEICGQLSAPKRLETFTVSYPGQGICDEWKFAEMVNESFGCTGNRIYPQVEGCIEEKYEDLLWHVEGTADISVLGLKETLRTVKQKGYKVVLNGQCGDESMFGYDWYYARYLLDLIKKGREVKAAQIFAAIVNHSALSPKQLLSGLLYYNSPKLRDKRKTTKAKQYMSDWLIEKRNWKENAYLLCPQSIEKLQLHGLDAISLPGIVRRDDRLYMSESLESRLPFMDYRFVELAASIPADLKLKDGYSKQIMRKAFENRLPNEIVWRKDKRGFEAPGDQWKKQFSQEYLLDKMDHAKTADYFKIGYLKQQAEKSFMTDEVMRFLQIEQFAQRFHVSC